VSPLERAIGLLQECLDDGRRWTGEELVELMEDVAFLLRSAAFAMRP
jgi:hypothetical protein